MGDTDSSIFAQRILGAVQAGETSAAGEARGKRPKRILERAAAASPVEPPHVPEPEPVPEPPKPPVRQPKSVVPRAAKPEDSDSKHRWDVIRKIKGYLGLAHCPEEVRGLRPNDKMSTEALDEMLYQIRTKFGAQQADKAIKGTYYGGMNTLEMASRQGAIPMNLKGLADMSQRPELKKELDPILDELVVEYGQYFSMGPFKRLVAATVFMVYTVHEANESGGNKVSAAPQSPME